MSLGEHALLCLVAAWLTALGVLMVARPKWLWKLEHWWDTVGGEPSDWYLTIMRVTGTLTLIFCGLFTLGALITLAVRLLA